MYSYIYFKLAKKQCFSYYRLCFFFFKIREGGTGSALVGGIGTGGKG
jgi:hypothetical protein